MEDDQQRVDVDHRREEVGDLGAGASARITGGPCEDGVERVAEGGPQARPLERVEAPRREPSRGGDLAADGRRVVVATAEQLGGAGEGLHDELGALGGGNAPAHARVDLGLGDEGDVGRAAGHQPHRDIHERVVEHHERAQLGEQLGDGRVGLGVLGGAAAWTTAPWRTSTGSEGMKR